MVARGRASLLQTLCPDAFDQWFCNTSLNTSPALRSVTSRAGFFGTAIRLAHIQRRSNTDPMRGENSRS